jgi:hypothetical protein
LKAGWWTAFSPAIRANTEHLYIFQGSANLEVEVPDYKLKKASFVLLCDSVSASKFEYSDLLSSGISVLPDPEA